MDVCYDGGDVPFFGHMLRYDRGTVPLDACYDTGVIPFFDLLI